jgi:hypothetical protein
MGWREVIHKYLGACLADSRQMPSPTNRAQVIDDLGTPALKRRERENGTKLANREASQQVPPPEMYKVIEESLTRVIAEVEKANLLELFCTTRFLVVKVDDQWKLDDIFWHCTCENGVCFFCLGKGYCTLCNGRGFTRWFFSLLKHECTLCNATAKCKVCSGTGRCEHCLESPIPGWTTRTNILRDDGVDG